MFFAHAGGTEPFKNGKTCLDILLCLVRLQPACDPGGHPLLPQPLVHRQIAAPDVLPHIAQVCSMKKQLLVADTRI